jgi:hypothetical protein
VKVANSRASKLWVYGDLPFAAGRRNFRRGQNAEDDKNPWNPNMFDVTVPCQGCGEQIGFGQLKCSRCGSKVPRELTAALHERLEAASSDYRDLRDSIASARSVLLIGALVYLANGVLAFAASNRRQFESEEDHELSLYLLLFDVVCSAVFAAVWWFAKHRPALAILLAGAFYVSIQALVALAIPSTIVTGLWIKGIVVILLVRGMVAAIRANTLLKAFGRRRTEQRPNGAN